MSAIEGFPLILSFCFRSDEDRRVSHTEIHPHIPYRARFIRNLAQPDRAVQPVQEAHAR